jgi:hypothetical protein
MYIVPKIDEDTDCDFGVIRESDGAFIPFDESNIDYQAYLNWKNNKIIEIEYVGPIFLEELN